MTKTKWSLWSVYLDNETDLKNRKWLESGRQGPSPIIIEDINMSETKLRGAEVSVAKFSNCLFSNSFLTTTTLNESDIDTCVWDDSIIYSCHFDKAKIFNCQFIKVQFHFSDFIEAKIQDSDWSQSDFEKTDWTNAKIEKVTFNYSQFGSARLYNTRFTDCSFQYATFDAAKARGTVFNRCDFRNVDLRALYIKNAVFNNCAFYGSFNNPHFEESCIIIDPDFSENFDGSQIASEEKLLKIWKGEAPTPWTAANQKVYTTAEMMKVCPGASYKLPDGTRLPMVKGQSLPVPILLNEKKYWSLFLYSVFRSQKTIKNFVAPSHRILIPVHAILEPEIIPSEPRELGIDVEPETVIEIGKFKTMEELEAGKDQFRYSLQKEKEFYDAIDHILQIYPKPVEKISVEEMQHVRTYQSYFNEKVGDRLYRPAYYALNPDFFAWLEAAIAVDSQLAIS